MLGGGEARRVLLSVLHTRDAEPHVRRGLVDAHAARHGHTTPAQTTCEAQHTRQAAHTILLFGRELPELLVAGYGLRTR